MTGDVLAWQKKQRTHNFYERFFIANWAHLPKSPVTVKLRMRVNRLCYLPSFVSFSSLTFCMFKINLTFDASRKKNVYSIMCSVYRRICARRANSIGLWHGMGYRLACEKRISQCIHYTRFQ